MGITFNSAKRTIYNREKLMAMKYIKTQSLPRMNDPILNKALEQLNEELDKIARISIDWTVSVTQDIHIDNIPVASIDHDLLLNFLANEHLTLPNTIANVLTDHNKVAHDALGIELLGIKVFINDSLNAFLTAGLTINQGGADDEILSLKASAVAVGCTDRTETDTYGLMRKRVADVGGLAMWGLTEDVIGLNLVGVATGDNASKDGTATAPIILDALKKSGTNVGAVGANANLVVMRNNWVAKWLLDEDGDTWQVGKMYSQIGTSASAANMHAVGDTNDEMEAQVSGKQFKENIKDLELDSSLIYQLRPVSFNSLCESDIKEKKGRFHGFIAQEIGEIIPEIVNRHEDGTIWGFDSGMLMTLMLTEIQGLNQRVTELEN